MILGGYIDVVLSAYRLNNKPGLLAWTSGRPGHPNARVCSRFQRRFARPRGTHVAANRERGRGGGGCPAGARRRRKHQGEAAESEEGDATSDLLLKHPDATLATYI
jgi:hypothetical protein